MAICTNQCAEDMIEHVYSACPTYKKGDATAAAFIFCDTIYNTMKSAGFSTAGTWTSALSASPDPENDLVVVNKVNVALTSETSFIDNPIPDGNAQVKDGTTFTFTLTDPNYNTSNFDFYEGLDGRDAYVVIAFANGDDMWVSEKKIKIFTTLPNITRDEVLQFTATGAKKFEKGVNWLPYTAQPAGIFDI